MTKYALDRIEEDIAVCESEAGETLHVRACRLPDGVREGSLLSFADGQWTLLEEETAQMRHELLADHQSCQMVLKKVEK